MFSGGNNSAKVPVLKHWTKKTLSEKDWAFPNFCDALQAAADELPRAKSGPLIVRALAWELDRELGSGNASFDLNQELASSRYFPLRDTTQGITVMRREHPTILVMFRSDSPPSMLEERNAPLYEWSFEDLLGYLPPDASGISIGSNDICALEIPWAWDNDEVIESFRLWLLRHRGKRVKAAGRKPNWRGDFINLACYRLSCAGYTRREVLGKLKLHNISAQNFARAKRHIAMAIQRRFAELCNKAKNWAELFPEDGRLDWQSHYLKT